MKQAECSRRELRVVQFQRRALPSSFSVERLFADVRCALAGKVHIVVRVNVFFSQGVAARMADVLLAPFRQGDINHITGDVHYVSYLLRRRRTVLTVLDCASLHRLTGWRRVIVWILWYWIPLRRVRSITTISEYGKQELMRCVSIASDRVTVIYPPVSSEFSYSAKRFNPEYPRILQIGTAPNKNVARVIDGLRGIPCQLIIVGTIPTDLAMRLSDSGIKWENRIGLTRAELVCEYRSADLVMFASTYEGFGLPIVEANAIGRPVITSNVCSMPEVAADAAMIVDPFDANSIRAAVEALRSSPALYERLVAAGLRNAERFQVDRIAGQYRALYELVRSEQSR